MPPKPKAQGAPPKQPAMSDAQHREQERHIRSKVECDKAAYRVQWRLLDGCVKERCLIAAAELLQPHHYEDITTERALDARCGYPCCGKALPKGAGAGARFHISVSQRKVYDVKGLSNFCSLECARRSQAYLSTLSPTSLFLRKGASAVEAALAAVADEPPKDAAAAAVVTLDRVGAATLQAPSKAAPPPSTIQGTCCSEPCVGSTEGLGQGTGCDTATRAVPGTLAPVGAQGASASAEGGAPSTSDKPPIDRVPRRGTASDAGFLPDQLMAARIVERDEGLQPPKPFAPSAQHDLIEGHRPRDSAIPVPPSPTAAAPRDAPRAVVRFDY